jgi:hypothetical protein
MNLPQQAHPGLPVVPHAVADELLGSWLLRIARFYGLSLREFVLQLSVPGPERQNSFTSNEL